MLLNTFPVSAVSPPNRESWKTTSLMNRRTGGRGQDVAVGWVGRCCCCCCCCRCPIDIPTVVCLRGFSLWPSLIQIAQIRLYPAQIRAWLHRQESGIVVLPQHALHTAPPWLLISLSCCVLHLIPWKPISIHKARLRHSSSQGCMISQRPPDLLPNTEPTWKLVPFIVTFTGRLNSVYAVPSYQLHGFSICVSLIVCKMPSMILHAAVICPVQRQTLPMGS